MINLSIKLILASALPRLNTFVVTKFVFVSALMSLALVPTTTVRAGSSVSHTKAELCLKSLKEAKDVVVLQPLPGQKQRLPHEIRTLRFGTYNLENFFMYAGKYERTGPNTLSLVTDENKKRKKGKKNESGQEVKSEEDRRAIKFVIEQQLKADILSVQESESEEALDVFSRNYLDSVYEGIARESNDMRIGIGVLNHRRNPFVIEIRQNTHVMWDDPADNNSAQKLFSRDALVSIYRISGYEKPFLIVINNHLKSKRDRPGDPESTRLRTAQADALAKIILDLQNEFGRDMPIAVKGDMNTDVTEGKELEPLRKLGFRDALDIAKVPIDERTTHTFHPNGGDTHFSQMDAIFLSPVLHPFVLNAEAHAYLDKNGKPLPLPNSFEERSRQPSDHRPVSAEIDFTQFIQASLASRRN